MNFVVASKSEAVQIKLCKLPLSGKIKKVNGGNFLRGENQFD